MEYNYDWFVNDLENPYSTPKDKPFTWQRLRIVGGRTLVWGRQSYRMSDLDFKAASHDGYGQDWPLPTRTSRRITTSWKPTSGSAARPRAMPRCPTAISPAMTMTCGEMLVSRASEAEIRPHVTIGRTAMLTQNHNGRAGVPLLRTLRTRLQHVFLLQQPVHNRRRMR